MQVTPPGAKHVYAVGVNSDSAAYVGTEIGVFRSFDGAATWVGSATMDESLKQVTAFVFDPTNHFTVYASTLSGVMKSDDGGESWQARNGGLGLNFDRYLYCLAIDSASPQTLYAAGAGTAVATVFKTVDGAATWRRLTVEEKYGLPIRSLSIDPFSPQTIYAGTDWFAYKSVNGGSDWQRLGAEQEDRPINVTAIVVDPQSPATVYASTGCSMSIMSLPPCGDGVFVSEAGGIDWTALRSGMGMSMPVWSLIVVPGSGIVYAGTYYGVFQFRIGRGSWLRMNTGMQDLSVTGLAYASDTDSLYAVTAGALWKLSAATAASKDLPVKVPHRRLFH